MNRIRLPFYLLPCVVFATGCPFTPAIVATSLDELIFANAGEVATFEVWNSGPENSRPLEFTVSANAWIVVSPTSGMSEDENDRITLTVSIDETQVPNGQDTLRGAIGIQASRDSGGDNENIVVEVDLSGGMGEVTTPLLANLAVTGTRAYVYPLFDPMTSQYALHSSDVDRLRLRVEAGNSDHLISVNGSAWRTGPVDPNLQSLDPGEDVVVSVANEVGDINHYFIHYLPADFPELDVLLHEEEANDGLLFVAPRFDTDTGEATYLIIADNNGVPHWYQLLYRRAFDFKLQPDRRLSYAASIGLNVFGEEDFEVILLDENFDELGSVRTIGLTQTDNHDFLITPEGNYVLISYNTVPRDLTEFGYASDQLTGDSVVQEITPEGEIVWEWDSFDHIDLHDCDHYGQFPIDYAHANSLFLTDDNAVLVSFRGCSQIVKVQRGTGETIWHFGGSQSDFAIVDDPFGVFCGQHTAIMNGTSLLMFDNGGPCPGDRNAVHGFVSRALEYELDLDNGKARFIRDYTLYGSYDRYASSQGGIHILPGGHWLTSWGSGPTIDVAVVELNAQGEEVFIMGIYSGDSVLTTYRGYRFPGYSVPIGVETPPLP